jgi:phosphatidylethanolamine-binding protein (PEBP) family uncharacterized protein
MKRINLVVTLLFTIGMTVAQSASALGVSFSFAGTKSCSDPKSPAISLSNVPKGTAKLKYRMVDLNKPRNNHGSGSIKYTGSRIPRGKLPSYRGPCPPSGSHTYEITITAYSKDGKKLGSGKAKRKFP